MEPYGSIQTHTRKRYGIVVCKKPMESMELEVRLVFSCFHSTDESYQCTLLPQFFVLNFFLKANFHVGFSPNLDDSPRKSFICLGVPQKLYWCPCLSLVHYQVKSMLAVHRCAWIIHGLCIELLFFEKNQKQKIQVFSSFCASL